MDLRNNRDFGNRYDVHGMGYRDIQLGQGIPEHDMYYHEGYLEQGIARELRQFRNLPPPMPPPPPVPPEFYDARSLALGQDYYPERLHDRSRDMDYGRDRNVDYRYRERGEERRWECDINYRDTLDRGDRRDYDNYREKDYDRDRDCELDRDRDRNRDPDRDRDRDWDREQRDYDRRDRPDRERERDRDRDRDWDRSRSSRDDRPKDEPRHKKERVTRWDDGYDKEKEREKRRESSREKDRERERDRDRDRDRDIDRDRERDKDRDRDRDRRSETSESKRASDDFKSDNEPTSVIMLRGLRDEIKEDDILQELYDAEIAFKDVRIVRNKIGYTRGFGFVEFDDIESAKQWMKLIKGRLLVQGYSISADYSRPKSNQDKDWNCTKCGTQNFSSRRRMTCFSCGALKEVSIGEEKESTAPPCKVLILKGLDVLTNEETVRTVLSSITSLPIFDIRLIRDKLTNTSRGFCFVELSSIEDASSLLETLQKMNPPFEIDGRLINTLYAKNSEPAPTTKPSNVATAAIEQAQWSSTVQPKQSAAAAMAIAQAQAASQTSYSTPYQQQMPTAVSTSSTTDSSTSSAAMATESAASSTSQQPDLYGNPHASNFVYDPMSGYYYDSISGLFYDSTTQYYYNNTTGQYLYWDGTTQQYVPVASNGSTSTALTSASTAPTAAIAASTTVGTATTTATASITEANEALDSLSAKEKQKKAKSLQAKKIAKDMERWAKNVNAAKPHHRHPPAEVIKKPAQFEEPEFKKPTLPPPKLLTVLNKSSLVTSDDSQTQEMVRSSPLSGLISATKKEEPAPGQWSSIVAEYGEDDDSDPDPEPEEQNDNMFADLKLMACLLCKRQFPNRDGLDRHMQFSDLHRQNLEIHKKMSMTEKQIEDYDRKERESKYRDRAKERRQKYNQPDISSSVSQPPPSRKRKGFQPTSKFEQPTKQGIGEDNIGNKMLRAMGWSQGSGLGKSGQGIVDPIKAQMRTQYAGLGSSGSSYGAVTGAESPGEKRRKLAMSRFNEL